MNIYFPEQQHNRYGVLRAVVKDTTNENNSSTRGEAVFLDSDHRVANNYATPELNGGNPMTDGKWHMATVTTQPDLSTGFLLYLDGVVAGEMKSGLYTGKAAVTMQWQLSELALDSHASAVLVVYAWFGSKHQTATTAKMESIVVLPVAVLSAGQVAVAIT